MTRTNKVEEYRKRMLSTVCTKKNLIVIYIGDNPQMKEIAREAQQLTKLSIEDRHKTLKFIAVKPLDLEVWR